VGKTAFLKGLNMSQKRYRLRGNDHGASLPVPKGRLKVAQDESPGSISGETSPAGTTDRLPGTSVLGAPGPHRNAWSGDLLGNFQPSLRDLSMAGYFPRTFVLGYFQSGLSKLADNQAWRAGNWLNLRNRVGG